MSAKSEPDSLVLRSATVIVRATVRTYLASLEDLTLKVIGVSSALASSAMVGCGRSDDWEMYRLSRTELRAEPLVSLKSQ